MSTTATPGRDDRKETSWADGSATSDFTASVLTPTSSADAADAAGTATPAGDPGRDDTTGAADEDRAAYVETMLRVGAGRDNSQSRADAFAAALMPTQAGRVAILRLGDLIVPVDIDPALPSHGATDWHPVTITLREWNETVLLHEVIHALIGTMPDTPCGPTHPQHEALVRRITEGLTAHGVTVPAYTEAPA